MKVKRKWTGLITQEQFKILFILQESLLIGYDISASGPLRIFEIMKNGLLEFEIKITLDTLEYHKDYIIDFNIKLHYIYSKYWPNMFRYV